MEAGTCATRVLQGKHSCQRWLEVTVSGKPLFHFVASPFALSLNVLHDFFCLCSCVTRVDLLAGLRTPWHVALMLDRMSEAFAQAAGVLWPGEAEDVNLDQRIERMPEAAQRLMDL